MQLILGKYQQMSWLHEQILFGLYEEKLKYFPCGVTKL